MKEQENDFDRKKSSCDQKKVMVLLGACLIFFVTTPYLSVFGLLYKERLQSFQGVDLPTVGTWIFAIFLFTWNFFSLFVGPLSAMQSHRWTALVGVFLMGSGSILSAFANSPVDLYLSVGLIIGSGQGLVTNTVIINIKEHFITRFGSVMGLSFTIMALGGIVTPQLDKILLSHWPGQTCIIIHGSAMLVLGFVGGFFLKSPEKIEIEENDSDSEKTNSTYDETDATHPRFDREKQASGLLKAHFINNKSEERAETDGGIIICNQIQENTGQNHRKEKQQSSIIQMFTLIEWSLLKNPNFIITALGSSYSFNALLNFYILLSLHADSMGCSTEEKTDFLSAVGGVDLFTRLLFGWLGDRDCVKSALCNLPRRMLYALSVIGFGVSMIGLTMADNYTSIMTVCIIYGFFAGGMTVNGPGLYMESFTKDFPSAMGLASIGRALAALSTGPLASFSKNEHFGITLSLWFHGGFSIFLMLIWIVEVLFCRRKTDRQIKV